MQKQKLEELIFSLVLPIVEGTELELVDVEYIREKDWYLRVFIDRAGGIEIDDCQFVSEKLTKLLDEKDPIKERYYLEVSSPGIDRPLKRDRDFQKAYGKKVDILFFSPWQGNKTIVAILDGHNDETIELTFKNEKLVLERKTIANIRPHLEF
ncbi:MAG TPA: ribosome maturation factor RimP [Candidatus Avacidaminococcus intestinavium]|uniref:Ribosome maturation factor RimP n=1 Tax=Candidatus Avacidaminococcus intestinavium TaxID=2840684 RepID=A0A9D1MRM9_9FIRM|nr:ribosome maturation factor RimP [Candidatus Avacidaminococcus intestinavium]